METNRQSVSSDLDNGLVEWGRAISCDEDTQLLIVASPIKNIILHMPPYHRSDVVSYVRFRFAWMTAIRYTGDYIYQCLIGLPYTVREKAALLKQLETLVQYLIQGWFSNSNRL